MATHIHTHFCTQFQTDVHRTEENLYYFDICQDHQSLGRHTADSGEDGHTVHVQELLRWRGFTALPLWPAILKNNEP